MRCWDFLQSLEEALLLLPSIFFISHIKIHLLCFSAVAEGNNTLCKQKDIHKFNVTLIALSTAILFWGSIYFSLILTSNLLLLQWFSFWPLSLWRYQNQICRKNYGDKKGVCGSCFICSYSLVQHFFLLQDAMHFCRSGWSLHFLTIQHFFL